MKKNYFNSHINSLSLLTTTKTYQTFLIILFSIFSVNTSFAQTITSFSPTDACSNSGVSVIIDGTGFAGATAVKFNGVTAAFFINNDTQITATLPAGATTGNIIVTPLSGADIVSATPFTVNSTLVPTVSIAASPIGAICAGTSVTFNTTTQNGGSNPNYQWYIGATPVGTNSPSFTTNSLANSNQVKVVMTSDINCAFPVTATSNIVTMTVNNIVTPSVTIEASQTLFCSGTSVTFSISTVTNGGLTPAYQWKLNGSDVGNGATFTSATLSNNDVVTLELTSSASCAIPATATSNDIKLTVNPNLPVSVSISSDDADNTVCATTSVTFTATPINGGSSPNYQWKLNGSNVGTNSTTYTNAALTNGDIISVVLTSNATCAIGTPAVSNTLAMTVNPNLPVSVNVTASATTICAGTSVNFTATPTNGGTTPVYQWKLNGANVGTNSATYTNSTLANGDVISVVLTSNENCTTGSPAISGNTTMIVNSNLPVSVIVAASSTTICTGTNVTFTATPTNGGASPSYQWKLNGNNVGTSSSTYANSAFVNGDIISVVLTSNATCTTGNVVASNNVTINVNPNLPASVVINTSATTICAGTSVTFTATPTNGGTIPAYQWKINGINAGTNSSTFTSSTLTNGQVVTVVLTSNATCATSNPATSAGITMTVNPNLPVSVSISSTATTICAGANVTFTATPTNGGATPIYQWKVNGINVGTNSATYSSTSLNNGAVVTVLLTSNITPCATGNPATSNSISMTVNPLITPSVSISTSTLIICAGSNVTFTATPTNGGATPSYQWKLNGSINVGTNTPTYTTSSLSNGDIISVVMTSNITCPSPTSATSNSITMTVFTGFPALANGSGPSTKITTNISGSVCPGAGATGITFTVPSSMGNATSYTWNLPPGFNIVSGAGTSTITVSVPGPGALLQNNQNVTVTAINPCGSVTSNPISVNVGSFAAVDAGPDFAMCIGANPTLTNILSGNANTVNWIITSGPGSLTGGPYPAPFVYNAVASGTVVLTASTNTATGSCSSSVGTDQVVITVNLPPSITTHPIASQTVCSTTNVSFIVTATGTGLTYQWRKGTTPLVNGGNISGATSVTLNLTNVSLSDAGSYNVVVSGASPCTSVSSSASVLTVNQVVAITSQPAVSQTLCSGTSASFNVTASGTGLLYQWRKGLTNLVNGGNISGATSANLIINPVSTGDSAADYNVVITGTTPCLPLTSSNSALVVNEVVAITSQPVAVQTVCSGTNVSFSVTATGTGLNYQWRRGTTNLINGGNISGTTSATLNLTGVLVADAGTYNVVVSGTSPCTSATSSNSFLNVNQIVAISAQPAVTQTVCSGTSASFNVTTTGTGLTYQWRKGTTNLTNGGNITGATSANLTINPVTSADSAADYNVLITGTAPCLDLASNNSALTVNEAIVLTSQPVALQTVCSGTNVSFTVTATGTGLSYQWKKGATSLNNGGNISGATSATLNIANVTPSDAATYTVLVSGASPCIAIPSSNAVLAVNQIVAITTQPASTQTVCSGISANLTVSSTGTGLTYQWRKGTTNLTNGGNKSGATSATLTINPILSADAGTDYNVVITGASPCLPVTTSNSAIVVNDAVSITTQPATSQTTCTGANVSFSVTATGSGLSYQWRKGTTNLSNGGNISGATSATLTLTSAVVSDAGTYNVVVSGASPCITATSANATLAVNKSVSIGTQPSNVGICASNPAQFSVVANGDGLTYQWFKGTFPGTMVSNSAFISGTQSNVLKFSQAFLSDDGVYYVVISGASPCTPVRSDEVTLNVDQSIAITSQPISKIVCEDTPNVSFSVTANAGGDPLTYQWRKNSVNIAGATAPTLTISTATITSAGNYDVVISGPSGYTCSSIQSAAALLTINPKPIGSATTQTICSGSSTNVALNSTVSGTTFSWIAAIQTNPPGGTITGFSDSSGNIIAQSLTNTGTSAGTIRYTITPTANSCIGITFTVDITVNPAPVGSAIAQTICSGSATNVVLNSNVTGTTYSWTAAIQTTPTGGTITGFSNGTQNTIVQTLNNTGTTAGIIRYTVTPTANSCSGAAFTVDVTVNPNSTIVLSSVAGSDNPTNCVNTVLNISYAIGGGGTNASITSGALPTGVTGSYNSGTRVYTISGTPSAVGTFSYTVTTLGLCNNASLSGSITVNPDATINLNLGTGSDNQTKCINSAITPIKYTISNGGNNPSISWNPGSANFTGSYNSAIGVYTISGSSAVAGTFNYTISTTGSCINSSLTGQIIVNPNPVGSAASQIICSGSVTNVALNPSTGGTTFAWTAASQTTPTGGSISGFGSGSGAIIAQTLTNTGTTSGSIRYTVTPTANSCPGLPFTVDVTVNPKPNGSAIAQTVCSGVITNIPLNSTVSGTTFAWTSAIITMPTGGTISGFTSGTTNTIAETLTNNGTSAGVIRYTVTPTSNNCPGAVFTVDVTVNAPTVGGTTTIASTTNPTNAENGTIRLTDCHSSGGVITLNGNVGTVVRWETSTNAGGTWISRGNAGSLTYNYTGITAATIFRAVIQNSSCTIVNSGISTLFIIPNIKPSPVTAIPSTICEGESTQLSSDSGFSSSQNLASGGLFNQANPPGWLVDDKIFPASGDNGVNNEFSETNGNMGDEYDSGDGKFAITRGNRTSVMQTPVFDLIGLTSANLTFDHAYKLDAVSDYAEVKISLDGGLTYTATLATFNGNSSIKNPFKNSNPANSMSLNLNAYLGYSNIKIGFFFYGTVNAAGTKVPNVGSTWAIDNIKIPQAPNPLLTSQWKNLTTNAIISVTNTTRVTVTPAVTTTYEVTSSLNGCTSYGAEGTTLVTVTVNKRPNVIAGPKTICSDDSTDVSLSSDIIGTEASSTFAWTVVQSGVSGASAGNGPMIAQKLTSTGASSGTAVYTISPTSKGCAGTAKTITVTVNPRPTANIGPNQTICYGETANFSIGLTGKAPWTITYTDGSTPTTVTTSVNPYVFSVSGITANKTYTISKLSDANCNPALPQDITGVATVTVLIGTAGVWTGLQSTDWFDCKNWQQGLPSSTINAVINSGFANMPVINPSTSPYAAAYANIASAQDIIIASGASVTMAPSSVSDLYISRDWKNSGTFTPGIGTVSFNGTASNQIQTINAGIKSNETFYNLTTNNSAVAKGISVVDGFELTVLNNLTLTQGDIRLTGEAQLVQAGIMPNPVSGSGKLLRDQQGQKNSFNYNYWSSPVSYNNIDYSIGSVIRDGTAMTNNFTDVSNFSPSTTNNISFVGGAFSADGALTSPITISTRWLFAFNSPALSDPLLNYYQWKAISNTASIKIGEGFTMKGTGGIAPLTATQNYVFVGKPNSGTISLNLTKDQTYLIGNPYPSALDADEFIKDNIKETINGKVGRNTENVFNGALYFWDHFGLSNNHYLAEYEGGYATYTLMGGTAAIADSPLTATGNGSKIPERYVPVAQGFFVDAFIDDGLSGGITSPICPTGCNIIFKNSQRAFVKESSGSSLFMKTTANAKLNIAQIDTRSKIRLGFDSPIGAHRQLLVGVDPNTTNQFDIGYDGLMLDTNDNDMFWEISNSQFVIQGVPNFDENQIIPLGITIANEGLNTIKIDTLENMPNTTKIYLYDNLTGKYHELRESAFKISLPIGEYSNRFSVRFTDKTLKVDDFTLAESILIYFTNNTKILNIKNNFIEGTVNKVFLFNLLGQSITNWDVEDQKQNNIQIPIKNVPSGVYIVKVKTTKGVFSKKIVIR